MESPKEQIIESKQSAFLDVNEMIRYKELFYFFTWRDIKIKYKQTFLGFLWAILQPLLMMVVFTFFFGRVLKIPSQNIPYPIFVFSGLLIWNLFSVGVSSSASSMINNASIIKKIYFPRLIIPVSSIMVCLFDFFMAFLLFCILLFYEGQAVNFNALWCWPSALALSVLATLGPGSWLAALNVKYRDFRYIIPFLIQILFFLTPVIYPVSMLQHPVLKYILVISPMYAPLELFRFPVTNVLPDPSLLLISITSCFFFLFAGITYFRRTEELFADLT
jgi:lipopolysaccharide transport system permease protein